MLFLEFTGLIWSLEFLLNSVECVAITCEANCTNSATGVTDRKSSRSILQDAELCSLVFS
jgi:hypothetical protein